VRLLAASLAAARGSVDLRLCRPLPNAAATDCTTGSGPKREATLDGTKQAALRGITANADGVFCRPAEHTSSVFCLRLDYRSLNNADGDNFSNPPVQSRP
jgi:hypothetical protein